VLNLQNEQGARVTGAFAGKTPHFDYWSWAQIGDTTISRTETASIRTTDVLASATGRIDFCR
jgi:hypothetical protein